MTGSAIEPVSQRTGSGRRMLGAVVPQAHGRIDLAAIASRA